MCAISIERVYNHLTTTFSVFIPVFIQTTLVQEWCFYKADLIIVNLSSIFFNWSSLPPEIHGPRLHKQKTYLEHTLYTFPDPPSTYYDTPSKYYFSFKDQEVHSKYYFCNGAVICHFASNIWLEDLFFQIVTLLLEDQM